MRSTAPLLLALLMLGPACVIVDRTPTPRDNRPGDITFLWSFDGEPRCSRAGVEEIDVQVFRAGTDVLVFGDTVLCAGGGLTLLDFSPGVYDLALDGFDRAGRHVYLAELRVEVFPASVTDVGVVTLEPVARTGGLALTWSFLYPTDDSVVEDCIVAGVTDMYVELVPRSSGGTPFAARFDCEDVGVDLAGIAAGRYDVVLVGMGSYQGHPIALYESVLLVDIGARRTLDLGDIALARIFESFADIELSWEIAGGSCSSRGVADVEISIHRLSAGFEDDFLVVPCNRSFVLRHEFVPGSYRVEVRGHGNAGVYLSSRTLNVAPNTTTATHLVLRLQ